MSTIYTSPIIPYNSSVNWPSWIILPQDNEPFTAASANAFETVLLDRNQFVFSGQMKLPTSNSVIKCRSIDGESIVISPYNLYTMIGGTPYFSQLLTPFTIDSSYVLPTPGAYAADTWYYIYLNTSVMGFEIVTTVPDQFLIYASDGMGGSDKSKKYISSFRTDVTSEVIPFAKNGSYVEYLLLREALSMGTALVKTSIDLRPFLPPHSKIINILTGIISNSNFLNSAVLYDSHETNIEATFTNRWDSTSARRSPISQYAWAINTDTPGAQTGSYLVNFAGLTFSIGVIGYWE